MPKISRCYSDSPYYSADEARRIVERRCAESLTQAADQIRRQTEPNSHYRRRMIADQAWSIATAAFLRNPDLNEHEAVREAIEDRLGGEDDN